ncbi:hypothetical protein HCUR_00029 [Holospora curviuscula]|uniref:HTH cro/C1-type domain-containing protein n=1 Tax=Holospora curviuscula TaxID=1082868 RepID=A0A2S5RIG6_9PROT|nr:hypothetical protein HCUR_00029 [Holospora curviuscula]
MSYSLIRIFVVRVEELRRKEGVGYEDSGKRFGMGKQTIEELSA